MKKIKITKKNVEKFAEIMYQFNCSFEYNDLCFSSSDIIRERQVFLTTDHILEQLGEAGFDISHIFEKYGWKVDDIQPKQPLSDPILIFENRLYENYLNRHSISEYYA